MDPDPDPSSEYGSRIRRVPGTILSTRTKAAVGKNSVVNPDLHWIWLAGSRSALSKIINKKVRMCWFVVIDVL